MKKMFLALSLLFLIGIPNAQAQDYTNSIGMVLTLIPAGTFMMGEDPSLNNEGKDDERPQHEVTISKPFYIGIYEATQKRSGKRLWTRLSWWKQGRSGVSDSLIVSLARNSGHESAEFGISPRDGY